MRTATPPRRVSRQEVVEVLPRIWHQLARRPSQLINPHDDGYRHLLREPAETVEALSLGEQTARYCRSSTRTRGRCGRASHRRSRGSRETIGHLVVAPCAGFILLGPTTTSGPHDLEAQWPTEAPARVTVARALGAQSVRVDNPGGHHAHPAEPAAESEVRQAL
jgi:hypothetical protein